MPISVVCDQCFGEFRVKDELAGKRVRCRSCAEPIRVPGGEPAVRPVKRRKPVEDELDDWDEPEEELPRPRVKKKSKKKRRESSFDIGQWVSGALSANIGPLLLQLGGAGLGLMFLMGFWSPNIAVAFLVVVFIVTVLTMIVTSCAILVEAAKEDIACLLLCLFVPFYYHYYWISRWEQTGRIVGIHFAALFGGGFTLIAAMMLYGPRLMPPGANAAPRGGFAAAPGELVAPQGGMAARLRHENPTELFPVTTLPMPKFQIGQRRQRRDGVPGTTCLIEAVNRDVTIAGSGMLMRLNLPEGEHQPGSLPCILIAPAGSTLLTGMGLDDEVQSEEKAPYLRAGYAVLEYTIDGADGSSNGQPHTGAYIGFALAQAGIVNGRNALAFVLASVPEVNPNRIFVAGHSSAAVLALLLAEHEPRIRGCLAYAPATDVEARLKPNLAGLNAEKLYPGVYGFIQRSSPKTHAAHLNCPVFLFHAQDDSNEPISTTRAFHAQLQALGKQSTFVEVPTGDHYTSMIQEGIPAGLRWLQQLPGNH